MKLISPGYAQKLAAATSSTISTTIIIDVSTPAEFNGSHIAESVNYPLDKLSKNSNSDNFLNSKENKILLTCQSGNRAQIAFKTLQADGFDVQVIEGGNQAWTDAGLPMVRGEGVISLERQVRITAGGIGLFGSLLSYFVAQEFIIIPTIIGAGLLNAGLTNWCGMGMLLAKMPWNNVASADANNSCETALKN